MLTEFMAIFLGSMSGAITWRGGQIVYLKRKNKKARRRLEDKIRVNIANANSTGIGFEYFPIGLDQGYEYNWKCPRLTCFFEVAAAKQESVDLMRENHLEWHAKQESTKAQPRKEF